MNPFRIPGMVDLALKFDALIKEEAWFMQVVIRCNALLALPTVLRACLTTL